MIAGEQARSSASAKQRWLAGMRRGRERFERKSRPVDDVAFAKTASGHRLLSCAASAPRHLAGLGCRNG